MSVLFWKWDRWTIYRHTSELSIIFSFVCMSPAQHLVNCRWRASTWVHVLFPHLDRPVEAMFEHASTLIHTLNLLLHPTCLVKHCLRVCISSILCLFFLVKTTTLLRLRTEEYQMSEVEFYCSRFKLSPVPSYRGQHYSVTKHLFKAQTGEQPLSL